MVNLMLIDVNNPFTSKGLEIEIETHTIKSPGAKWGDLTTLSLIPFVEYRPGGIKPMTPYLSMGLGLNFNRFKESSLLRDNSMTVEPVTTLAVKIGGGVDYLIAPDLVLNAEIGWKQSSGRMIIQGGTEDADLKAKAITVLLGIRRYFWE